MKKLIKQIMPAIFLLISMNFMFFIYAPYELFITNQWEFWFDLDILLPISFASFGIMVILGILIAFLINCINKKMYYGMLTVCGVAIVASYVQGTYCIKNLPPLDGADINWNNYPIERVKSICIWLVLLFMAIVIIHKLGSKKFEKIITVISVIILFMNISTMLTLMFTTHAYGKEENLKSCNVNMYELSSDTNFIILVLDTLESSVFKEVLEENPQYQNIFEDFTYYDDTLCAYPFTRNSIPYILTGVRYENQDYFSNYTADAVESSKLINILKENNYKMGLYTTNEMELKKSRGGEIFENMRYFPERIDTPINAFKLVTKMAAVKFAPWDLKRFAYDVESFKNKIRVAVNIGEYQAFNDNNRVFYKELSKQNPITMTEEKCFRFIHLEGAHYPYQYDKELNVIENGTLKTNVEACFTIVKQYIGRLKESGVYDNSVIIIMADHGFDKEFTGVGSGEILKRMHATLLIKGINEKHPMKVSSKPIAFSDLQDAFVNLLDGQSGEEVFGHIDDREERERRFLIYEYNHENYMEEYMTDGKTIEIERYQPTGNIYQLKDK